MNDDDHRPGQHEDDYDDWARIMRPKSPPQSPLSPQSSIAPSLDHPQRVGSSQDDQVETRGKGKVPLVKAISTAVAVVNADKIVVGGAEGQTEEEQEGDVGVGEAETSGSSGYEEAAAEQGVDGNFFTMCFTSPYYYLYDDHYYY